MTPEEILTDLSQDYSGQLPRRALKAAGMHREELVPVFLSRIDEAYKQGREVSKETENSFLFIFHLLAEWRETRAYRPLIDILRLPDEQLDPLIGEGLTSTAWRVMYSVFDGDFDPIISLIEDESAYEFSRSVIFDTLAAIAFQTPSHRPKVISILEAFYEKFGSNDTVEENYVWSGWCTCICDLGATELLDRAKTVYDVAAIEMFYGDWQSFEKRVHETAKGGKRYALKLKQYSTPDIESAVEELSTWHCFSETAREREEEDRLLKILEKRDEIYSKVGKVGRNDPCPCGSGKKFKKCCLE